MAITHIAFCAAVEGGKPVLAAEPAKAETLTANGTTTITATRSQVCRISTDTAVYVAFGATPTAAAGSGHFVPAGSISDFGFLQDGWKVAVTAA